MTDEDDIEYTLTEFCKLTSLNAEMVRELVGAGIVEPHIKRDYWTFSTQEVSRCLRAGRLMRDLELSPHGAALALELMEQNRRLQRRLAYLERLIARLSN